MPHDNECMILCDKYYAIDEKFITAGGQIFWDSPDGVNLKRRFDIFWNTLRGIK
jgi:hypothetical protein